MLERTHERGNRLCFALFAQIARADSVSWNRQDCKRQNMQRVQNTWSIGIGLCTVECSDTNVVFQTAVFLALVVRNNKTSPGINSKTIDCFSGIFLITVILLSPGITVLWIVWICDCCFFSDFLMVRVLLVKNYQINIPSKFGIFV